MESPGGSFASRSSGLFGRADATLPEHPATRHMTTYEVPLFLSPAGYQHSVGSDTGTAAPRGMRTPTESFEYAATSRYAAAVYPASASSPSQYSAPGTPLIETPAMFGQAVNLLDDSAATTEDTRTKSRRAKSRPQKHRRRRRPSTRQRIQTLRHFSFAYGITLLASLITYLVLAFGGIASGVAFHTITVIFLLILTGLFLHSAIRLILLSKHTTNKKNHPRSRTPHGWYGSQDPRDEEAGVSHIFANDLCLEKPVQIMMKEDELLGGQASAPCTNDYSVQQPPPIYGNFRGSKRIDPGLVHWQKICPSPLTPTYAEAIDDVHRAMGYRPPSYIQSECGTIDIVQAQTQDIERTIRDMRPLGGKRVTPFTERHV